MKKYLLFITIFIVYSFLYSQNAKTYYKTGIELSSNGKYDDAIAQFSKTIEIDKNYVDAYIARANAYEKMGKIKDAAEDYNQAATIQSDDEEILYNSGRLYFKLKEYKKAVSRLDKAIAVKSNYLPAYQLLTKVHIADGNIANAKIVIEKALLKKNDAENNYYYGYTLYHLKDFVNAEKYLDIAIKKDDKLLDAYEYMIKVKRETNQTDEALDLCNKALEIDQNDIRFYILRSDVYKSKIEMNSAINDMSKAIIMDPDNKELYFIRGNLYKDFTQFQSAISDYNKVLLIDPEYVNAYYERAKMYEEVSNFKAAIKDYQTVLKFSENDPKAAEMLKEAKLRMYELNRETNIPVVKITDPLPIDDVAINVPNNKEEITINGQIIDESELKSLTINENPVTFTRIDDKSEFNTPVNIKDLNNLKIVASDVYDNTVSKEYTINYTETVAPQVDIIAPYTSDNGEIYLLSNEPNLYIEGKINDESKIKSIMIDEITASFRVDEYNPTFSATLMIQNKDRFTVTAVDEFGNQSQTEFTFNKEGAELNAENPMGKTWVIFIENSKYENYPSLDGPAKDVSSMRSALANYQIHNFIHKKDLSKSEMERFFNIELRDLVRSNMVNSLLIWYAGHGKFINETGYWIPVDAKRDDEFSFFNIGNLKASMQLYSKYITHLLLVTDACESGPTFYQAMRGTVIRDCGDWKVTRFKSSQVFTSAGYELAVDNSQFTKTFANTLANNPDACIPIESIVNKVTEAVVENNQQKPKFGKISGLEDENGTFFFITK